MKKMSLQLFLIVGSWLPLNLFAASFDCNKATTSAEFLICAIYDISNADSEMDALYEKVRPNNPDVVSSQMAWLKQRNSCPGADCLRVSYKERIQYLKGMLAETASTGSASSSEREEGSMPQPLAKDQDNNNSPSVSGGSRQSIQPAFINLMYLLTETAHPSREDIKFIDWWANYYDGQALQKAKFNEIALADLRDSTLRKMQGMKGTRLVYNKIPVHLGKYDAEKEEFPIEFSFWDAEKQDSLTRSFLRQSCLVFSDNWNGGEKNFSAGAYWPFTGSEQANPAWSLIVTPDCTGSERGQPVAYIKLQIKQPPPWGNLHVPRSRAKDLLDWLGPHKLLGGKFVFRIIGEMEVTEPKTFHQGLLQSEMHLRTATVEIEPIALFLWTAEYQNFNYGQIENSGIDRVGSEKSAFNRFVGALGKVVDPSQEPMGGEATGGVIMAALSTSEAGLANQPNADESRCPSNLPTNADRQDCARQADLAKNGLYMTQGGRLASLPNTQASNDRDKKASTPILETPQLTPDIQKPTLKPPEFEPIPVDAK
ncbi:lysozyme inhibitor LprI family protein [Methylomicrobium sp. Wu6]|uniref:lysozyme inhibitor LprI family protein n=1 Tax=Methylomicrobium sp. Wu6 TaxID=3107928 RepID=UPI002DD6A015|nr:lysozyme inhibitor LprI family protein [Methylomicrobium sp. Wu6]MEC4749047.1 hypothetical protein [Methylomicrobium sp. Wu6]